MTKDFRMCHNVSDETFRGHKAIDSQKIVKITNILDLQYIFKQQFGFKPCQGHVFFPGARNFTLIALYWLLPGTNTSSISQHLSTQSY